MDPCDCLFVPPTSSLVGDGGGLVVITSPWVLKQLLIHKSFLFEIFIVFQPPAFIDEEMQKTSFFPAGKRGAQVGLSRSLTCSSVF